MPSPGKLRVVLHIGGAKCGSSAIQAYLARNAGALARRGLGVPGVALDFVSEVTGEQIWFFEDAASAGNLDGAASRFAQVVEEAERRGHNVLVISAENLCNHPAMAAMFREAVPGSELQVVFYVRRQDDFLDFQLAAMEPQALRDGRDFPGRACRARCPLAFDDPALGGGIRRR